MPQEQTKNLLINIATGAIIVGVIIAGYLVFKGKQTVVSVVSVAALPMESAEQTVIIGTEIEHTVRDLQDLKASVENSVAVFSMPAFKNLQDFSIEVPPEAVGPTSGRTNPFIPTEWKLREKAMEEASSKQASQGGSIFSTTAPQAQTKAPAAQDKIPASLFGNFGPSALQNI